MGLEVWSVHGMILVRSRAGVVRYERLIPILHAEKRTRRD